MTVLAAAFSPWWDKHGSGGALGVRRYPKEIDAEILNAMGIADDVLKSEATGSWAGKAVSQQATYCILEQWLSDLICDVDRVIERLVEINFGPGHQRRLFMTKGGYCGTRVYYPRS